MRSRLVLSAAAAVLTGALSAFATVPDPRFTRVETFGNVGSVQLTDTVSVSKKPWNPTLVRHVAADAQSRIIVFLSNAVPGVPEVPADVPGWTPVVDPERACVERRLADGGIDTSYGNEGRVELPAGSRWFAAAVDSKGRVVALGLDRARDVATVLRLDASGAPDAAFGDGGTGSDLALLRNPSSLRVDAEDRVVVVSPIFNLTTSRWDWLVARLDADGTLDSQFGALGFRRVQVGSYSLEDGCPQVALDAGGRILLAGAVGPEWKETITRLTSDGAPDPEFHARSTRPVRELFHAATGMAVDDSGRIVIACGETVVRLLDDGRPDPSWGTRRRPWVSLGGSAVLRRKSQVSARGGDVLVLACETGLGDGRDELFDLDGEDGSLVGRHRWEPDAEVSLRQNCFHAGAEGLLLFGGERWRHFPRYGYVHLAAYRLAPADETPRADLEVAWVDLRLLRGRYQVRLRIRNRGARRAAATQVDFLSSQDGELGVEDPREDSLLVPPLAPGRARNLRARLGTLPSNWTLFARVADPGAAQQECNDVASATTY